MSRIVVFGGNGYVGQRIVSYAAKQGLKVTSINRSGAPSEFDSTFSNSIEWFKGDIFQPSDWKHKLEDCDGVISCVGAFGSNEFMEKINGDANILAVGESLTAGVKRFVYVSTVENSLPEFVLKGYFNGKRRAEVAVLDAYPSTGIVLRPGFIYGTRDVPLPLPIPFIPSKHIGIPLWLIGRPLETILTAIPSSTLEYARSSIPGMKAILAPPVSVDVLASVATAAATGKLSFQNKENNDDNNNDSNQTNNKNILTISDIVREG
eukprot:gene15934-21622_t